MEKASKHEWAARFALDSIPRIGCRLQKRLLDVYGSAEAVLEASRGTNLTVAGVGEQKIGFLRKIEADRPVLVKRLSTHLKTDSVDDALGSMIGYSDRAYPTVLKEIDDPPPFLWYRGDLDCLTAPCVAVVGTRRASAYGKRTAHRLGYALASAGITIVSGLAYGIDKAAHEGALDAGGQTVAVLGSGLNQIYPRGHRALALKIEASGCLLSEFRPDTLPDPKNFPQRNRIISGLSKATIVVEAFEKAGALITANLCIDQKRDLYAVPGRIDEETSSGTNALLASSAAQALCSANQVLIDLGLYGKPIPGIYTEGESPSFVLRSKMEQDILDTLRSRSRHIDDLEEALEFPGPDLWSTILKLECDGEIRAIEGNRYERVIRTHFTE